MAKSEVHPVRGRIPHFVGLPVVHGLLMVAVGSVLSAGCRVKTASTDPSALVCGSDEVVVSFETEDGILLYADYKPAAHENRGAVILFHMVPPGNDRTNYPQRIRDAFASLDLSVLNVDRRGAGQSQGNAEEAYKGEGGRLDMEAAVRFLTDASRACRIDSSKIALVGASNGTTSVLDYTVAHAQGLPSPKALIWMSPGTYTENQHKVEDYRTVLDAMPIQWLFPESETYSLGFQEGAPSTWEFHQQPGDSHGTHMFDGGEQEERVRNAMETWLRTYVGG